MDCRRGAIGGRVVVVRRSNGEKEGRVVASELNKSGIVCDCKEGLECERLEGLLIGECERLGVGECTVEVREGEKEIACEFGSVEVTARNGWKSSDNHASISSSVQDSSGGGLGLALALVLLLVSNARKIWSACGFFLTSNSVILKCCAHVFLLEAPRMIIVRILPC